MERSLRVRRRRARPDRRRGHPAVRPDRGPGVAVKLGVDERIEIVATVLLALATVATAWSGYQASRWNGEQAKVFSRGAAARIESAKAAGLANAQTQVDVATFTQWVDAYALERTEPPTSTSPASVRGPAGRRRLGGDPPAQEHERAADPVRDARVPARSAGRRRIGSRRTRKRGRPRRARTSSARRTTCSGSSSSRPCSSSPASPPSSGHRRCGASCSASASSFLS